jgi:hypothetical protein
MAYKVIITYTKSDDNPWILANGSPVAIARDLPEQAAMMADSFWAAFTNFIDGHPPSMTTSWQAPDLHTGVFTFTFDTVAELQQMMVKYFTTDANRPFYENVFSQTDSYYTLTGSSHQTIEV